jgi:predicted N-acetyltransferase YhbS
MRLMQRAGEHREFAKWRRADAADLPAIVSIGNHIHQGLPESAAVFAEKLALFAEGCFVLARRPEVVGYCLSHPWRLNEAPALDGLLGSLPDRADCLLIHDVAIVASERGHGAAGRLIRLVEKVARRIGVTHLALVSVYGTYVYWARFGFEIVPTFPARKLGSYGPGARYMVRELG